MIVLLVEQALSRHDLLLRKEDLFPLEVHWKPKSESVQRILGDLEHRSGRCRLHRR